LVRFVGDQKFGFISANATNSTIRPMVTVTTWPMPRMESSRFNGFFFFV